MRKDSCSTGDEAHRACFASLEASELAFISSVAEGFQGEADLEVPSGPCLCGACLPHPHFCLPGVPWTGIAGLGKSLLDDARVSGAFL